MCLDADAQRRMNLCRWRQSGAPARWVQEHGGVWDDRQWQALLQELRHSDHGPLAPDGVGALLEELKRQWWNLQRWKASGAPARWVQEHGGRWTHDDWLALLEELRASPFWPINPDEVGRALEEHRLRAWNLQRWADSGEAGCWVEARQGVWNHDDWLTLLEQLRASPYGPLDEQGVGQVLEEQRQSWRNLRGWLEQGARCWVQKHQGNWSHSHWLALLEQLRGAGCRPFDLTQVGVVLEGLKRRWLHLRRWVDSGASQRWLAERQGRWDHEDWEKLVAALKEDGREEVDTEWLHHFLREEQSRWWNLLRFSDSGLARRWVEEHQGGWTHQDWLTLLEQLRRSDFWPMHPDELGAVLEELRAEQEEPRTLRFPGPTPRRTKRFRRAA